MHECLRLSALQSLPISIRRQAQAAASGSTENLDRVVTVMTRRENRSKLVFLLPLLFRLLDPARIPSSDPDLGTLSPAENATCHETMLSFDALAWTEDTPRDVAPDVWSRVWRWFLFLDRYRKVHENAALDRLTCSRVVSFASTLLQYPGMDDMIKSTPGFYGTVVRAWIAALYPRDVSRNNSVRLLQSVSQFLADTKLLVKETLEAFIDDHDPAEVAMWALRHGDFGLTLLEDSQLARLGWGFIAVLLVFLTLVLDVAQNLALNELPSRLLAEFANQGVIEFIVRAAHGFSAIWIPGEDPVAALSQTLDILQKFFQNRRLYPYVRSPVFIGFVHCVAVCAQQVDVVQRMPGNLTIILSHILASCTIHIGDGSGAGMVSVFAQHEQMLPNFPPDLREEWTRLVALVKDRTAFAESLKSAGIVKLKACDNAECTTFGPKNQFQRCSGCATLYYCSVPCQTADWRSGHRGACRAYDYLLSGRVPCISPRQRYFMRALLDRDYKTLKLDIFSKAVECMRASRDARAGYFVMFDYSKGGLELSVHSLAEPTELLGMPQWEETVARVAKSRGRMTIHVIGVREANDLRQWILPLRSDSRRIYDELVGMACTEGGEHEVPSLADLVAWSNSEVVEFH